MHKYIPISLLSSHLIELLLLYKCILGFFVDCFKPFNFLNIVCYFPPNQSINRDDNDTDSEPPVNLRSDFLRTS